MTVKKILLIRFLRKICSHKFLFTFFNSTNCVQLLLGSGWGTVAGVATGVAVVLGAGAIAAAPYALSATGFTRSGRCNMLYIFYALSAPGFTKFGRYNMLYRFFFLNLFFRKSWCSNHAPIASKQSKFLQRIQLQKLDKNLKL